MSFFHYSQNNSGGSFTFDERRGITHHVVIEADNAQEANERAETFGLYFDGDGDCSCCGSRWSEAYGDGDEVPSVYGGALSADWKPSYGKWIEGPEVFVHYLNGTVGGFGS